MVKYTLKEALVGAMAFSIIGLLTSFAMAGSSFSVGSAFAQQQTGSNTIAAPTPSNQTSASSASGNNETLSGIITSLQLNNVGAPQWLTAGSWTLVTDKPIFGGDNQTQPQVKSFDAVIVMTSLSNGTQTHSHHISDFKQIQAIHTTHNSTLFNGTMTVTTENRPAQNASGYLIFQNDRMSIVVSPADINSHFGPTPINGIILTPQLLQEIRSLEAPSLQHSAMNIESNSTSANVSNMTAK